MAEFGSLTKMENSEKIEQPYRLYPSAKLCIFLLALLGCTMVGGGFAAFNFAIVCMVNETATGEDTFDRNNSQCADLASETETGSTGGYNGEFVWDKATQASLLAAHAFGAIAFNLPAGLLSDRYGSKIIFALSVALNGLSCAITPVAAFAGVPWLFAARVVQGIGAGVAWPSILAMVSRWGTLADAGVLISIGAMGFQLGPLLAMASSSVICDSSLRWPFIFYVWAALSGLFVVLWFFLYTDDPRRCRFISQKELAYVEKWHMRKSLTKQNLRDVPWKAILLSPAVFAVYACQFCATWGQFYIGQFMPTYSKEVLRFDVRSNGFTSAAPALCQVVCRALIGPVAERVTFGGRSKTFSVKFFTVVCTFGPSVCFVALAFLDCRHGSLAVALFCFASLFLSCSVVGYLKGGVLVAARYAGLIGSLGNVTAYLGAVVMPYSTGAMVKHSTVQEWQGTLFLVAGVLAASGIQHLFFGTAEEQPWASGKKPSQKVFAVELEKGADSGFTIPPVKKS